MKTTTLTTFKDQVRAHMLQDLLMNEGITSILQGVNTSLVMGHLQGMEIQVLVFEKDYERAYEILKDSFPEKAE